MITRIHVRPKVEKTLEQMKNLEKVPSIAAKRAEMIIQSLMRGLCLTRAGRLTQTKDARIKNLYKFNLGSGYRLVCIKEKHNIYVLFAGSHDQCDTWLDKHRKKRPHKTESPMNIYDVDTLGTSLPEVPKAVNKSEYDYFPIPEISQEDLRKVFRGLVGDG
ncbi:MAG: hypothetical protein GXP56_00785 [Deltaproteobacteria bacterium]|nr:hypothetical protein [Deltaproteobacteria bacterium]